MKTIVAGSRSLLDYSIVRDYLNSFKDHDITEIVCGGASGPDTHGKRWGLDNNVEVHTYNANWKKYGKSAGYVRNKVMALNADALIAFWDGESRGTKNMIELAEKYGLKVTIVNV